MGFDEVYWLVSVEAVSFDFGDDVEFLVIELLEADGEALGEVGEHLKAEGHILGFGWDDLLRSHGDDFVLHISIYCCWWKSQR